MTVPDWLLERYALGEVGDAERAAIEADPDLPGQLERLAESDTEVRRTVDGVRVARLARQRAGPPRRAGWRTLAVPVLAVGVTALLLVGVRPDDGHRPKGSARPGLILHRQLEGGSAPISAGEPVLPGEVVQIEVVRAGYSHGWVVSVDGAGAVTVHNDGVLSSGSSLLPEGYRLDDAPDFEQFWLVVSERPIDRAVVEAAARAAPRTSDHGVDLDLPDAQEHQVWVRKP